MTRDLHTKLGSMEYEKLFAGLQPPPITGKGTIRKLSAAATIARGTLLAKSSTDGKLVIFGTAAAQGETLSPDCVLADDINVGTANDENVAVYLSGCFNEAALTMAANTTLTEANRDTLRMKGILLGTVQEP